MLSIQNETVLRDSASGALDAWRREVPRGSPLDQIMEDVMNHVRAAASEDDLRNEINELEERNKRLSDTVETYRVNKCKAEADLRDLTKAHQTLAEINADTAARYDAAEAENTAMRAKAAALIWLIPGSVSLGELRDLQRTFAADFAELERLRVFEAARLEQDRQQAEDKAAAPEPDPASAEIPEEMFDTHELVTLSPERIEELKRQFPGPGGQIIPIRAPSRSRLDNISRRAHEIADGRVVAPDVRRLADLLAALANAVEPKS